jgi:hypothetical protein
VSGEGIVPQVHELCREDVMPSGVLQKGGAVTKIVFLTPRPIAVFEAQKWAFAYLGSEGFEVEVLELTRLLNKSMTAQDLLVRSVAEPLRTGFVHSPHSWSEFEEFVSVWAPNALFIDYLVGAADVSPREERVFRILKKHRARYSFILSGALPMPSSIAVDFGGRKKVAWYRFAKAFAHPSKLLNLVASKVILFLTRQSFLYPMPAVIFSGNSSTLERYVETRHFDRTKVVAIHSLDYDTSISFRRGLAGQLPVEDETCVFLDEAATHHSDFEVLGVAPASPERYFPAMNQLFDAIEKTLGLAVVIAAHPRSNYDAMPEVFHGRRVVKGRTIELVARCKLVVMHASTSLSYAVLFRKPVLPVYIPGMVKNNSLNLMVDVMGAAIGSPPLDIEKGQISPSLLQRPRDFSRYAGYEKRYVKSEGLGDFQTWEIVARTLKTMTPGHRSSPALREATSWN